MSQIDHATDRIVETEWEKARLSMEMQIRSRDNAAKAARMMLVGHDVEAVDKLKAEMAANTKANEEALEELDKLVVEPEAKAHFWPRRPRRDWYRMHPARARASPSCSRTPRHAMKPAACSPPRRRRPSKHTFLHFMELKDLQKRNFVDAVREGKAAPMTAAATRSSPPARWR